MPEKDLISKQLLKRLLVGFSNQLFGLDITRAKLLNNEQPRIESRRADLVARVKDANGKSYILHVEIQNDNQKNMPLRMLRYYSDIALAHVGEKVVQHLLYIGKAPLSMPNQIRDHNLLYHYEILDMRKQNSEHFLDSGNPDAIVLAILCEPSEQGPNALVARIIKELRRLHGDKLNKLRNSLKMLEVLAGNRNLQNVVKENVEMYIDVEKLGIYQLVKEKSEAKGVAKGEAKGMKKGRAEYQQEIVLQLLTKLPSEQVADLSGISLAKVRSIARKKKSS